MPFYIMYIYLNCNKGNPESLETELINKKNGKKGVTSV
jgi:hypothetical protein